MARATEPRTAAAPASAQETVREVGVRTRDVLMVAPTMFFADYGCHVRILEESLSLRRLGHQIRVLAYPNGRDVEALQVRRCPGVPFNYRVVVGSNRHKLYLDGMLGLTALHEISVRPPELIHAHLHEGALIGRLASLHRRRPLLFDFQGSLTSEMVDHGWLRPGGKRFRAMRAIEQAIDRLPAAVITSSTHAADLLMRDFSLSPNRIFPVLDSVNTDSFRPAQPTDAADLAALRDSLAIPPGRRVVLYLGLLAAYQGTDLLLHAAARLIRRYPDLHFLIMGFPGEEIYRLRADALGIGDHVTFTGRMPYDQAARHLRLGDVAVAPKMSETEGSGKILNYMATALPTVAFDTPVSREYLGHWGSYAAEITEESFAAALERLLESETDWRALGNGLRERACTRFSWRDAGRRISEIYDLIAD